MTFDFSLGKMCNFEKRNLPTSAQDYHPFLSRFFGPLASGERFCHLAYLPCHEGVVYSRPSWRCALAWGLLKMFFSLPGVSGPPGRNDNCYWDDWIKPTGKSAQAWRVSGPRLSGLSTEMQFCLPAQTGTLSSVHRGVNTVMITVVILSTTEHVLQN